MNEASEMRIGVTVPNVHETLAEPATIEAVGRAADELGFDSIWVNDHVAIPSEPTGADREPAFAAIYAEQRGQAVYEPLVTLAYLAAVTKRVLLGTSVYLLPLRHPVLSARQIATLDQLSGGRLVLGVGVGWLEGEFDAVAVSVHERGSRTDEAIAALELLWSERREPFEGRHYAFPALEFRPKPARPPRVPIWVGGRSDAAMRRAARIGDGWQPSHLTTDELRRRVPELRAECERIGRSPDEVVVATRRRLVLGTDQSGDPERILRGGRDEIARTLAELESIGVGHMIIEVPGTSRDELLENLDWLGREVLGGELAHA